MDASADIVVAGAGQTPYRACYLAKAGYRCLVLDAGTSPGRGGH